MSSFIIHHQVSISLIARTDGYDTKKSLKIRFNVLDEIVGYDIYGVLRELVDKNFEEVNDPEKYGKLTIDGSEIEPVGDTDIEYTIECKDGIGSVLFKVYYDKDVFEFVSIYVSPQSPGVYPNQSQNVKITPNRS